MAKKKPSNVIATNKRARFDYHLLETFEAGLALEGWEVKSLRAGKAQLPDSYVLIKNGEAWLLGSQIVPLETAASHFATDSIRTRKLLLHKSEIRKILSKIIVKSMGVKNFNLLGTFKPGFKRSAHNIIHKLTNFFCQSMNFHF